MFLPRHADLTNHDETPVPLVAVIGTPLQFSDRMLRILNFEFADVGFVRFRTPSDVPTQSQTPKLIIVHESLHDPVATLNMLSIAFPELKIAVAGCDRAALLRIRSGGNRAIGVVQINTEMEVWLSVLRLLLCGHDYVPADLLQNGAVPTTPTEGPNEPAPVASAAGRPCEAVLTPREREILPMIARGMPNRLIADQLGLSQHTVKLHTHNIFSKIGVRNRTGAANWYHSKFAPPAEGGDHAL